MPGLAGEEFEIVSGSTRAVVTEVGATLRSLSIDGIPVLWGFPEGAMSSDGRGQILAPWPNRLADGSYRFGTRSARAALDEPERHNAIHGLVRWLRWEVTRSAPQSVSCVCRLAPQPAYPWWVRLHVDYSVTPGALLVETTAVNLADELAPFALGFHPYLDAGEGGIDAARLSLPARRHLVVDERMLPVGSEPIAGTPLGELADGIALAGHRFDDAFTDLDCGADGRWRVNLWRGDGVAIEVWADVNFTHVMCFTGDTLASPDRRRAVAIEPMTAPPNALASGDGIIALARWDSFRTSWGITAH